MEGLGGGEGWRGDGTRIGEMGEREISQTLRLKVLTTKVFT